MERDTRTAEERAHAFVKNNPHLVREGAEEDMVSMLTIYLKEQDRDTRHACADAVLNLEADYEAPVGTDLISPDTASKACINVRAT